MSTSRTVEKKKHQLIGSEDFTDPSFATFRGDKLRFTAVEGQKTVVLVSCGSFSPPTMFHLRLMEEARDALVKKGVHVAGGFISPVHAKYGKKSLVSMHHRLNMVGLSLQDSDWLEVDLWECAQDEYTPTAPVLVNRFETEIAKLCPDVRVQLVCGADLLATFSSIRPDGTPVWLPADVEIILTRCGVVCMAREGTDVQKVITDDALLVENQENITLFTCKVSNNVSSTLARELLQNGGSVRQLVPMAVIDYIRSNDLWSDAA